MTATVTLKISKEEFERIDKQLAGLPMLSRMPAIKKGLRARGKVVEKRLKQTLPPPGYPGDKPGLKPLRDTTATKVKEYPRGAVVAIVGFESGAGSHGHFVEEGHRMVTRSGKTVGFVPGGHYLAHAVAATESEQSSAMESVIAEAIAEAKGI